ncbi:MAG: Gfo/Idh/MocA family protein [bacterium]
MALKVIQVGVGGFGARWTPILKKSKDVKLVGLVDVSEEALKVQVEKNGIDPKICYTDLDVALKDTRPEALVNVTPPAFHKEIDLRAFGAGCHVLSEKPLSDNYADALEIVEEAERRGLTFMVSQNYRFRRASRTVRRAIEAGACGKPGCAVVNFFKGPRFTGFRVEMEHPLIVDMAIHHFDMMRYFLGTDPVSLYAKSWNPPWSWYKGDAACAIVIEMRGGIFVSYNGNWASMGKETSWNGEWRFECSDGVIWFDGNQVYTASGEGKSKPVGFVEMPCEDQEYSLLEFVSAISERRPPETNGADNLKSLSMVFKSLESLGSGREVYF